MMATTTTFILCILAAMETMAKNLYFDRFENVVIKTGIFLGRISIPEEAYEHIFCIGLCQETDNCLIVAHERSNGSFCALWTFNDTTNYYPIRDETSTLYMQQGSKNNSKSTYKVMKRFLYILQSRYSQQMTRQCHNY